MVQKLNLKGIHCIKHLFKMNIQHKLHKSLKDNKNNKNKKIINFHKRKIFL
jgi:hypothetical protein